MNQEQVKEKLLELDSDVDDFIVTFSGKASRKVHGLYYPERKEIIIHNQNFTEDNSLIYTAIHEFAHHVQFIRSPVPVTSRSHTVFFWNTLHILLEKAEEKKIYVSVFRTENRFLELTGKIKEKFLAENGKLMKEFGALLIEAFDLCREYNASWEDYSDRILGLHRTAARTLMKINALDINPEIGYENMKTVARIKEGDERKHAERAFLEGKSPDMVKTEFFTSGEEAPKDPLDRLFHEKSRLEKNLAEITERLEKIETAIREFRHAAKS